MIPKLIERVSRPFTRVQELVGRNGLADGGLLRVLRRDRRGRAYVQRQLRYGTNHVHALVDHPDGSFTDVGLSTNLLTNIGRDWWSGLHGFLPTGATTASPATAVTATSVTVTGTPLTASNLATPQLGCAGMRVWMPVTGLTTPPVYGNVVSNTTSVLTIDQWWKVDDTAGTTPAGTNAFQIAPGGLAACRFLALSTNALAASASNTVLANEVTTNGGGRALATYAHTFGNNTLTLQKAFSITGTITSIHKVGLFTALTAAGADPMIFESVLNADATVVSGDTLTVTWTATLSG